MAEESIHPVEAQAPAPKTPAHAADKSAQVEQRLGRIEHSLVKIAEYQNIPLEDETIPTKSANKPLVAAAFGFAGLKLGGFTLGKFGLATDLLVAYHRNKVAGLQDTIQAFFNAADKEKGISKHLPFMFTAGIVGAAVGAVGGAALGWQRGDRLKSAGELFTHPIDSMKKIFAKTPPKHIAQKELASPELDHKDATTISSAAHEGTVSDTVMRERA